MEVKKFIWFNIVSTIVIILTIFLYLSKGLNPLSYTTNYLMEVIPLTLSLIVLFTINLLVNLSYVVPRALYKKNLLRFSLIFLVIMFLLNIGGRIYEIIVYGYFCIGCWINLIFYVILIILNYMILKELFYLIRELFGYQK